MKLVTLNIRGTGGGEKRRELSRLLEREKPDVLALQEIMLQQDPHESLKRLWRRSDLGQAYKPSSGRSGGQLFFWNTEVWSCSQIITGDHYLGLTGEWKGKTNKYLLLNVYGPQLTSQKRALWAELRVLINNFQGVVCLMGDLNVVRRPNKRNGSRFKPIAAGDFNSVLRETELQDIKQGGRRFTWVSWDGVKMSILDRFLVSAKFSDDWEDATAIVGDRVFSDHCPVTLTAKILDCGPPSFRCYDHWLRLDGFTDMVKKLWGQIQVQGQPDFVLKEKLKGLKKGIID